MDYANVVLALFAGLFSILSPCVLPLVPIVLGTAVSEHRLGPLALAAGLATSFTAIGLFVATIGYSVGLDGEFFRVTGAVLLVAAGFALMLPRLQIQLALVAAPLGNWTQQKFGSAATAGLRGQFGLGLLLGAVWSPCVGTTLGAASVLAAQGRSLGFALTMLFFGLGSAVPLIALGLISREAMMRARHRLLSAGTNGKTVLGGILIVSGLLILFDLDHALEAWFVRVAPSFLLDLGGRY
ncbi:MAG TPA: cytochrome c biogenesis protein CcdA [Pyrinomonadaceae bacterium]|nr:cytochrome c biogenesis protein CcdA [Pyrinomonadaceae bacterium]